MSLTGWPLLALLGVLFVVFTVVAVIASPSRRLVRLLQRIAAVLLSQLCAVMLVLVAVNDWGMFYGSWDDLFGGTGDVHTVTNVGGGAVSPGLPPTMVLTGWSHKDELATKGGVFELTLVGPRSKLSTKSLVFLPPEYFQKGHENERFPVVETIAGYPGDVPQLVQRLGYPAALDKAVKDGKARPMILVMMKPTLVPPRDTECVDVPKGPQTLTFFSKDVPGLIKKDLRTTEAGWGAMGHSTGGYCAAKLAMTNPAQFSTAVSLSGFFSLHQDAQTGDIFGGSQELRNESDLLWRLKHRPVPNVAIFASMGQEEGGTEGMANTREFIAAVRPPMKAVFKVVDGGGHNFGTYQRVLPDAFAWLSQHVRP